MMFLNCMKEFTAMILLLEPIPNLLNVGGFSKQLLQRLYHSKEQRKYHFNYMKILQKLILMNGLGVEKWSTEKTKYGF